MADIFISYAREDLASAKRLANALEQQGWSVWWDRHIPAGKTFEEVIEQAIDEASCVLVLWSTQSVASGWVRTEANEGLERGILVPALIEEVRPPLAFRRIHAANLIDWGGEASHANFQRLVGDITGLLGPPPAVVEEQTGQKVAPPQETDQPREVQAEVTEATEIPETATGQPGVSSTASSPSRKFMPFLGAGFLALLVVLTLFLGDREPTQVTPPVSHGPLAEAPDEPEVPSTVTVSPSPAFAMPTVAEISTSDLQLSQQQWREVQQALNDIGFDAGPNDGIPGAKTISAIALFQESRGVPPTGQLNKEQRNRLLADAKLAAKGRLNSVSQPDVSSSQIPEMVEIPATCFQMGSPADEEGRGEDERQHEVCFKKPFNLESAVGRVDECVHGGAEQGATTRNSYSIPRS